MVGRYANRIAGARFAIDGREHRVSPNEPPHHLHGGFKGFDKRVWDADVSGNGTAVVFRRRSPDGEEGYPGALDAQVTYTLADRELRIGYQAAAEAPTHVNLTQHSYFNLRGNGDVLGHCLAINASTYLPVDERLIPTGELAPVAHSPFDFQEANGNRLAPSRRSRATETRRRIRSQLQPQSRRIPRCRLRRVWSSRPAAGRSSCARPSLDCSSIRARWSAIEVSASSPSTIPTRRTGPNFPRRCSARRALSIDDRLCIRHAGPTIYQLPATSYS